MKRAWICYWFDEFEIENDRAEIKFEKPDLDEACKWHKIVPIEYNVVGQFIQDEELEDLPFFLKPQAE